MDRPVVSIVVPIYNVEQYLEECVDSILDQTYMNLQVILVNDGSPDRCGEIIEKYRSADKRVVAVHKENGGAPSARNEGIKHAIGDYIAFVDSDDILHHNYIHELLKAALDDEAEIAVCDFIRFRKAKPYDTETYEKRKMLIDRSMAIFEMYKNDSIGWNCWNKLYRRCLFEEIQFPEGQVCEDKATIYKLFLKTNKISYIKVPLYYYRVRKQSISSERSVKLYMDSLHTNAVMERDFEIHGLNEEMLLAKSYSAKCAFILYSDVIDHAGYDVVKEKCLGDMAERYRYIYHAKYLKRTERIAVFLAGISAKTNTKIILRVLCKLERKLRKRRDMDE